MDDAQEKEMFRLLRETLAEVNRISVGIQCLMGISNADHMGASALVDILGKPSESHVKSLAAPRVDKTSDKAPGRSWIQ